MSPETMSGRCGLKMIPGCIIIHNKYKYLYLSLLHNGSERATQLNLTIFMTKYLDISCSCQLPEASN